MPDGVAGAFGRRLLQSQTGGLVLLTSLSWLVYGMVGQGFLSSFNMFTLSQLVAQSFVIGLAQLVILAIGRMNLAVGAVGVSVVMLTGWLVGQQGVDPVLGICAGLVVGATAGALMGWLELKTGLSSFIVTLAMSSVYIGAVLLLSNGDSVNTIPASIAEWGANYMGIPSLSFLIVPALVAALGLWYLYNRTSLGWKMLAVGANEPAAGLSGIRTGRVVLISFALSGLLCGVAGVMEMARVSAALPSLGTDWLLIAFIVPVLGGTSLHGGSVSIGGALLAALFLESTTSGLTSLRVDSYWLALVQAFVLLAAVLLDDTRRRRRQRAASGRVVDRAVDQAGTAGIARA